MDNLEKTIVKINDKIYEMKWEIEKLKKNIDYLLSEIDELKTFIYYNDLNFISSKLERIEDMINELWEVKNDG